MPPARGAHARRPSSLGSVGLVWVYPDLLSTYGDRGNLLVLERRARLRGLDVESVMVHADQPIPQQADIYLMGGGEDLPQILAVCAGYQLLGREFGGEDGQPVQGLEILNMRSGRSQRRGVGEILADVD